MLDPKTLHDILQAHVTQARPRHVEWDRRRAMYQCKPWGEGDGQLATESGALFAHVDTMVASVVPPNPQITCKPRRMSLREQATYREGLINDAFIRGNLDLALWKEATHAAVYPRGVLKVVWNMLRRRPEYNIVDPRFFFFDEAAAKWEDVRYVIEVTPLTEADFASRVRKPRKPDRVYDGEVARRAQFGSFPAWLKDTTTGRAELEARKVLKWTVVFEVFDFSTPRGRYYHFLENEKLPLFAGELPYLFVRNPYVPLVFNDDLETIGGLGDSQIIENPVNRRDELLTLRLRHAQSSIPVTLVNEEAVSNVEEAEDQLANATSPGDMVRLKLAQGYTMSDAIGQTPTSVLSPSFDLADQALEREILFRLGMPGYARGMPSGSDLATEVVLIDEVLRTRLGHRTKLVEKVIKAAARYTFGLYEEFLGFDDILPVRLGGRRYLEIHRQHLGARNPTLAERTLNEGYLLEEPLEIDYEVLPFSPLENNKTTQLARIRQAKDLLYGNVVVDQVKLSRWVVDLLDGPEDLVIEAPAAPSAPLGPPTQGDTLRGGGLPLSISPEAIGLGARPGMAGGPGFPTPEAK